MFNIRNLVNRISLPGRDSEEGSPARRPDHDLTEAEGFLCPTCMIAYATPDELQSHYEVEHLEPATNYLCPVCKTRYRNSTELENHFASKHSPSKSTDVEELHQELNELNTTLREERWYTEELKKEVERLQNTLSNQDATEGDDVLKRHIKGLEESKQLLSSEVILLRKQLAESLEVTSSLKLASQQLERSKENEKKLAELVNSYKNEKEKLESELNEKSSLPVPENDKEVERLHGELKRTQEENQRLQKAFDEREAKEANWEDERKTLLEQQTRLEEDLRAVKEINSKTAGEYKESCLSLQERQREIETLRNKREETDAIVVQLRAEVTSLQELLNQLNKTKGELSDRETELFNCKTQVQTLQREMAEYKSRMEELGDSYKSKNREVRELENRITELQTSNQRCETAIQDLKKDIDTKSGLIETLEQQLDKKDKETKDAENAMNRLNETVLRLEKERAELLGKIEAGEGVNTAIQQLQVENASLQEELAQLRLSRTAETSEWQEKMFALQKANKELHSMKESAEGAKSQLETSLNDLKDDLRVLKQKLKESEALLSRKEVKLTELSQDYENARQAWSAEKGTFLKRETQLSTEKQDIEAKLSDMQKRNTKFNEDYEVATKNLKECRAELEKLEITHNTRLKKMIQEASDTSKIYEKKEEMLKAEIKEKDAELERLNKDLKERELKTEEIKQQWNSTQDELQNALTSLTTHQNQLRDQEEVMKTSENKLKDAQANVEAQNQEILNLKKRFTEIQQECGQKQEELESLKQAAERDSKLLQEKSLQIDELQARISSLALEVEQSESQLKSANEELWASQEEVANFQLVKVQLEGELDRLKEATIEQKRLEKELLDCKDSIQMLQAEKLSLENHFSQERASFQLSLEKLEKDMSACDIEKNRLQQGWDNDKKSHQKLKEECEYKRIQLEGQLQALNDNFNGLKLDLKAKEKQLSDLQISFDETISAKLELEAHASVLDDERKEYMQKCADLDHELEKLKTVTVDVRRRLEDSQAALHELCRENQSLQMENAKLQGQKWADDSAVTSCTACYKEFSLTVRKHHCRNCGQIFCNDCSAKSAVVGGSKKPLRVCEACYKELATR